MCRQCKLKPVYEFTNKRKLCKNCFIKYFQKKVLYIIRKFKMIKNGDVIVYENSGDFREVVLEDVLKMFAEKGTVNIVKLSCSGINKNILNKNLSINENLAKRLGKARREAKKISERQRAKLKITKIAIPSTIDLEANKIIHTLLKGKVKDLKNVTPVTGEVIKLLYLFLDEEILLYAKLKRLKFSPLLYPKFPAHSRSQIDKDLVNIKNIRAKRGKISLDKISKFIDELEKKHPEVKRAIVNSYLELYN